MKKRKSTHSHAILLTIRNNNYSIAYKESVISFVSFFSYTPTTEEGLVKMHRSIRKEDVSEISDEDSLEDIDTAQDDEIQYRSGRLERASGNTMFHPVNESDTETNADTVSLSQTFSATGSYNMELKNCRKISQYMFGVQKKKILSEMEKNSQQESLKAKIDKSE